jgi:hypothetical protein
VRADSLLARTVHAARPGGIEVRFGRQVLVPLHPMKAIAEPHPVRLDRARVRQEELRSGTTSAHREFSIDGTCIHHLIDTQKWTDVRLIRGCMSRRIIAGTTR